MLKLDGVAVNARSFAAVVGTPLLLLNVEVEPNIDAADRVLLLTLKLDGVAVNARSFATAAD